MHDTIKSKLRKFRGVTIRFAKNSTEARTQFDAKRPDIVTLDSDLEDCDGLHLIDKFAGNGSRPWVIVYSGFVDPFNVYRVKNSRAMAFVEKHGDNPGDLREAVDSVMRGRQYYSERVEIAWKRFIKDDNRFSKMLSEREMEILGEFGSEPSDDLLAQRLGRSVDTIKKHRQHLMDKLNLHTAAYLVNYAFANGFTRPTPWAAQPVRPVVPLSANYRFYGE